MGEIQKIYNKEEDILIEMEHIEHKMITALKNGRREPEQIKNA